MQRATVRYVSCAALAAALLMAGPARSDPVVGQADPAFTDALELWLAGEEDAALPQLAGLAQDDNRAAQILLGLIDTTPALQGDWLMDLPRGDRIALMRMPGGLSGQNWMRAAAAEPLAQTWLALWDGNAPMTVIVDFGRQGEARAARIAAMTLAKREKTGFAALVDDPAYPAAARAFAIREWQRHDPTRAAREAAALPPADPQGEILGLRAETPGDTAAWLSGNPDGDPLVALCAGVCPGADQPACQAAAYQAMGGYWEMMTLGSPVESIVSSDRFNRSPAGLASALHRLRGTTVDNACLAAALK